MYSMVAMVQQPTREEGTGRRRHEGMGQAVQQTSGLSLEPTPHPAIGYTVYISPLLSEQILTVKLGKAVLYLLLFSLVLCFFK
jgi:hypothetical protein